MSMIMAKFMEVKELHECFRKWVILTKLIGKELKPITAVDSSDKGKNILIQPNILKCCRIINGRFM